MTDYSKETKVRVQVMVDESRYDQITKLAEVTGSSVSRIVRLALDSKSDEFDKAILQAGRNTKQEDLYRPAAKRKPATKPASKKTAEEPSGRKPFTSESFTKLVKKQNKR